MTTDDWPYFYQHEPGIPLSVILISALIVLMAFWFMARTGQGSVRIHWHFFFLGAGFLLLEVQIISKIALLFGTTWVVNSIVVAALLLLIVAANATVSRIPTISRWIAYAGILIAAAVGYFVPMQSLFFPNPWVKGLAALAVLCLPVYFAGIIFARSFAEVSFNSEALGFQPAGSGGRRSARINFVLDGTTSTSVGVGIAVHLFCNYAETPRGRRRSIWPVTAQRRAKTRQKNWHGMCL